jgi:hypothetical protein
MPAHELHAVLTGDVVGSTSTQPAGSWADVLRSVTTCISLSRPEVFVQPSGIDVFRGDSWQLVARPAKALWLAVLIRALLRAYTGCDSRIAIGVGLVDTVPSTRVSEGSGPAYVASGRALTEMAALGHRLSLSIEAFAPHEAAMATAIVRLLDGLIQGWTTRQALAIAGQLRGWSHEFTARQWVHTGSPDHRFIDWQVALTIVQQPQPRHSLDALALGGRAAVSALLDDAASVRGISHAAVSQHLKAANWSSVELAISAIEGAMGDRLSGMVS